MALSTFAQNIASKIKKKTSTTHTTYRCNRKVEYIVEHYTATSTSKAGKAIDVASGFASSSRNASADFIVDDSYMVQYNPDISTYVCWAVGGTNQGTKGGSLYKKATNDNCISIEICSSYNGTLTSSTKPNDKNWYFTDAVLKNAMDLTKYLMELYGIDSNHVIRHYDVNGKLCPGIVGYNADSGSEAKWKAFKASLVDTAVASTTATATSASTTSEAKAYIVTASSLNVRSGAGTSYSKLGSLVNGKYVKVLSVSNGWGKITYNGKTGYICIKYAKLAPTYTVTASVLNVRKGPGTSYAKVGQLKKGATVQVLATSSGWCEILYDGSEAWVSSQYLK